MSGIEWIEQNETEDTAYLRNFFRLPVDTSAKIKVRIDGREYRVVNLANSGVGIRLLQRDVFQSDDHLNQVELEIEGKCLSSRGRVVHVSLDDDGSWLCGVELVELDKEGQAVLRDYVDHCREVLFAGRDSEIQ
ncbi:MAG: PilZ domain-containing protein [Thermodesulfobacteriota bacterium]|nr:PilZ domain-containing protein [Thermodesulfobacteriota bacterium]